MRASVVRKECISSAPHCSRPMALSARILQSSSDEDVDDVAPGRVVGIRLDWSEVDGSFVPDETLLAKQGTDVDVKLDVVIGSDVVYRQEDCVMIAAVLKALLRRDGKLRCIRRRRLCASICLCMSLCMVRLPSVCIVHVMCRHLLLDVCTSTVSLRSDSH